MTRSRGKQRQPLLYGGPVDCGVCTLTRDRKASDETRTVSEVHSSPDGIGAFGLFAGHGGATAADLCARNFVPTLLSDSSLHSDPEGAIRNTCQALEAFVVAKSHLDKAYYGTTLLFGMIKDHRLFVANIGNSRAVLYTQDGVQTITRDHDGSNAEEVARVRNAGGFLQDGKINNLIRITRSIGDVELKDRKHITFPTLKMTEDIVTATPDIFCRHLSVKDKSLILATAEVWEHLSNSVVAQIIQESLKHQDTPHAAAKKISLAAMQSGARGPLSVMVLVFPTAEMCENKTDSSSKKLVSRINGLRRHSSNGEQKSNSTKKRQHISMPAFVRAAQVEVEQDKVMQRNGVTMSPIASPKGSIIRRADDKVRSFPEQDETPNPVSSPLLAVDMRPGQKLSSHRNQKLLSLRGGQACQYGGKSKKRADSALGIETVSYFPDDESEFKDSRRQIDMERKMPAEKRMYSDRKQRSSVRAKTTMVSRISELTASETTGDEISNFGSVGHFEPGSVDFIDTNPLGPSKVRYREDGSIHTRRFWFLKDLGRTFARKR